VTQAVKAARAVASRPNAAAAAQRASSVSFVQAIAQVSGA
jgi:hypothetical protein